MTKRDRPRLLSFTLDDWPVLGGPVSLTLSDGVAVLVGRNGSGKSAIVEGFTAIAKIATNRFARIPGENGNLPKTLVIDILTPQSRRLRYEYHLLTLPTEVDSLELEDNDENHGEQFSWNDSCQYLDQDKEIVWRTEFGETTLYLHDQPLIAVLGSFNLLDRILISNKKQQIEFPAEMEWLYHVLSGCQILNKQAVRKFSMRRESLLKKSRPSVLELADMIAHKIIRLDEDVFDELTGVCSRIGIADQIVVKKFVVDMTGADESREDEQIFEVSLNGTNIGFLSDGTLRVLSILVDIIRSSSISTLIIEEPEQQIHPGLLSKLLREIQAYTVDENLIISTHSPQVVAEMRPEQIHLVERVAGRTTVRQLNSSEIDNVHAYLTEEGDLGEWLYSGMLDDE